MSESIYIYIYIYISCQKVYIYISCMNENKGLIAIKYYVNLYDRHVSADCHPQFENTDNFLVLICC